ncbi:MAG: type III-B CRISPR module RAMP protein Cmr1 [Saprospiraceae bacterium]|nr:type III-B CRISPR module RAMP protein Cmr1 [Saprospiraceae bacterium]
MQSITFTCEVMTPMFLNGADGYTPELRAPSIKGVLRFWWRAMNGHLSLSELKRQEGEIFGDNEHRSKFTLFVLEKDIKLGKFAPIPHKGYKIDCIDVGSTFDVTLSVPVQMPNWTIEQCKALFELTCILGDFGKRARRGMGSVEIIGCTDSTWKKEMPTIQHIHNLMQQFSRHYIIKDNAIYNNFSGSMEYYPWIRRIEIGKDYGNYSDLLMKISKTTHHFKENNTYIYEASLGHASRGRFASPIYVSVAKGSVKPIVTSLNPIPDRPYRDISLRLQDDFRNEILK